MHKQDNAEDNRFRVPTHRRSNRFTLKKIALPLPLLHPIIYPEDTHSNTYAQTGPQDDAKIVCVGGGGGMCVCVFLFSVCVCVWVYVCVCASLCRTFFVGVCDMTCSCYMGDSADKPRTVEGYQCVT